MFESIRNGDYAYLDFLLLRADRAEVEAALTHTATGGEAANGLRVEPYQPGLLARAAIWLTGIRHGNQPAIAFGEEVPAEERAEFRRMVIASIERGQDREPDLPFTVRRNGSAELGRLLAHERVPGDAVAPADNFVPGFDDHRVSSLAAAPGWVLVEFKEMVSGASMMAGSLSGVLQDTDVLYFRLSGKAAAERRYDFHVNTNFAPMRRVLCHETRPRGAAGAAGVTWWEGITDGAPSPYEPDGLYDRATEATLLDNRKLEAILAHNGLSLEALFAPGARLDPVLFSRRPGGETLN